MLVPEILVLFVCPSGCGRHGALGAIETGNKQRVAYLCIDETDIVCGRYESMIPQAVNEMINRAEDKPKALFIFVSCLDDLLGTDLVKYVADPDTKLPAITLPVSHILEIRKCIIAFYPSICIIKEQSEPTEILLSVYFCKIKGK